MPSGDSPSIRRRPTALVTGAAGFIGSHLVDHLLARGWRVRGVDNLSTGRRENLRAAEGLADFEFVEGTVLDERLVSTLSRDATQVFHLAGRVGASYVEQSPERTVLDTIRATTVVLAAVRDTGAPLFFVSTSEIYGDSVAQPLREDADVIIAPPAQPRSSYALGKGASELLVNAYARGGHGPVVIGRLFNTIGPRQSPDYGSVVPRFVRWARSNSPIIIQGDGEQTRCFTAVHDAVRVIADILKTPAAHGQTVNIGSCEEVTINQLARLVLKLTGSTSTIQHEPYDAEHGPDARDVRRRVPSVDKLRRLMEHPCVTPLEATIRGILDDTAPARAGGEADCPVIDPRNALGS